MVELKHKNLLDGRWRNMSLEEKIANIDAKTTRMRCAQEQNNKEKETETFALLEMTISEKGMPLKELLWLKECLSDTYLESKNYRLSLADLENYCLPFATLIRR